MDELIRIIAEQMSLLFNGTREFMTKAYSCLVLAFRGFMEQRSGLRASALTFFSILSVVPFMAMAFGIAKGFGFEKLLEKEVMESLSGHEDVALKIIDFSERMLAQTQGGVVASLGILVLLWSVFKMLGHMEAAFNDVWHVKKGRPFLRRVSDYIALTFTAPIMVIFAGSLTVYVKARLALMAAEDPFRILDATVPLFLKLLPFITMSGLFVFLYLFIPYRQINFRSTLIGGILTGTTYQVFQTIYINFQVGVSHQNAVYGSFAALPLFLTWIHVSWTIVLFGAHFAHSWENMDSPSADREGFRAVSFKMKKVMGLAIVMLCVRRFIEGGPPMTQAEIARGLDIPMGVTGTILDELKGCGILSEVSAHCRQREEGDGCKDVTREGERAWQPARDVQTLTVASVSQALEEYGDSTDLPLLGSLEFEALIEAVEGMAAAGSIATGTRLLKDI
ncbi:MAG: YihY/virulence factor BrkB family protein [Desulfamplus sp.]|nr:YihY/virulence factor BrkB family protein [Desulfamplus sp.]